MQTLIRALFLFAALWCTGALLYLSFAPAGTDLASLPQLAPDKVNHIAANYVLTLLLLGALPRWRPLLLAGLVLLAGAGVEYLQGRVGRSACLSDLLANAAGICLVLLPAGVARLAGWRDRAQMPARGEPPR